jgi:putative endonuclease
MNRVYSIYILASRSRNLYTGVTGNLHQRMLEHRQGLVPGFTTRYQLFRLVHLEHFADIRDAIAREKEIKAWRREKKIRLIEHDNPTWEDLSAHLPHSYSPEKQKQIPHTARQNREPVRDDTQADTQETGTPKNQ